MGIKSAVGEERFWLELATRMARTDRGVDFVTVDGGEGGTGAAPLVFSDHVALPFKWAFPRVYRAFADQDLHHDVVFIGSGKLGIPENALLGLAMGCDMVNVGREVMLAIGCIQAQKCHTDECPTGVATQNAWLMHGLDPTLKAARCANYIKTLRRDLLKVSEAVGVAHPALITADDIDLIDGLLSSRPLREVYGYGRHWGTVEPPAAAEITRIMAELAPEDHQRPA